MQPRHTPIHAFRHVCTLLLVSLLLAACAAAPPRDSAPIAADLQAALDRSAGGDGSAPRNALLAVDVPGAGLAFEGAAGIGRADSGTPIEPDHQFLVASVAKAMTAVVVHQLAEEGALGPQGVDTTLGALGVLPPEVLEELHRIDGASYGHAITLRHLLNHTSGLRDVYFDTESGPVELMPGTPAGAAPDSLIGMAALDPERGLTPLADCTLRRVSPGCDPDSFLFRHRWVPWDYAAWQARPDDRMAGLLNFYLAGMNEHALWEPGSGFHYSDTNYILLGLVVERASGHSLHHELRERIFDPLDMQGTYLIGAADPPATKYEGQLADVWAWGEPAMSAGVDFSFDWGGGGIVSTLRDLRTFMRALAAGALFDHPATLESMLAVPEGIRGMHYASGLVVFPSSSGPVLHMLGSNGTWVEYYAPLDLVMVGTVNDFSNPAAEFRLHGEVYQILASHGLSTPMARLYGLPTLGVMISLVLLLAVPSIWLVVAIARRRPARAPSALVAWARWLTIAALLANVVLLALVGMSVAENPFQMLFDFTPQVRALFTGGALVMGAFAAGLTAVAVQLWRRGAGTLVGRSAVTTIAVVLLVYAVSIGAPA